MRLKHVKGAEEYIASSNHVVQDYKEHKGNWNRFFANDNPVHIEIGMGKGQFLMEMASLNPDINYIGIERYSSVLIRAVQKKEELDLPNLTFILMDATEICEVFAKQEIERIYLNFSDPWPKDRHAKRRLPSRQFLERFKEILKDEGQIEFKTDNKDLFAFALEEVEPGGFKLIAVTHDLHHDDIMNAGNVMTEYEKKFSALGNHICKYVIKKNI
ncbi:MAG: tRNA (guanosine(46)-N7)-methyltransferase TrmB [Lachnospiraceae bacterium]|nr:tRNA (guanosine(46)-N7)-methyltransferase TrmB [Lachnospiraceae bacterium]